MSFRRIVLCAAAALPLLACRSAPRAARPAPATSELPPFRHLPVNGVDLAYVEQGTGVPVVFVHGSIVDLREWEPQRAALAERYRFIAYSLRDHWPNAWVDGKDYSYETHAADLASFIRSLGAGPVHVVGHSSGATVALVMALDHPDVVRSLVLIEPSLSSLIADDPQATRILKERGAAFESIRAAATAGDEVAAERLFVDTITGEPGHFDRLPESVRAVIRANQRTVVPLLAAKIPTRSCAQLGAIQAPSLVLAGERTTPFFAAVTRAAARCLPHARLEVIRAATHLSTFERPASVNEALLRFLAEQRG